MKRLIQKTRVCIISSLVAAAFATPAQAQSNINIYGYLDLGMAKESNGAFRLDKGYNNWIGFKGQEDLGAGNLFTFNLQTRFNPDTGASETPTLWQGETTVGFKNASLGHVRFGRANTPLWSQKWVYEPWEDSARFGSLSVYQSGRYSSDGVHEGTALGYSNFARISNGVFYDSPTWGGFAVHFAGEVERFAPGDKRNLGISLNYGNGSLSAMFGYEKNHHNDSVIFVGSSYKFGPLAVMGSYARDSIDGASTEKNWILAATYDVASGLIRTGYGRNQDTGNNKFSVGYKHNLSKRTALYTDIYREKTTATQSGVAVGINHWF